MSIWPFLLLLLCCGIEAKQDNSTKIFDLSLATFPGLVSQFTCKFNLECQACQTIVMGPEKTAKKFCLITKVTILRAALTITLTMDNEVIWDYDVGLLSKPCGCCQPIPAFSKSPMCLRFLDFKKIGLSNLNFCPAFYYYMNDKEVLAFKFACLKLSIDGLGGLLG